MIRHAFSRAAAKPEGSGGIGFLEAILRERPDLRGKTAYFPAQGNRAHTVFIGNEVFKGPNGLLKSVFFDEEHQVLKQLEGKGLPVPKVTCVGKEAVFFGMTRLPGVELGADFRDRLTVDEQCVLAKDLVNFLVGMACALPVQERLFAVHDDLHAGNILIDPETKRLSAVIDFGFVTYAPKDSLFEYVKAGPVAVLAGDVFNQTLRDEYELRKAGLPDAHPPAPAFKAAKVPNHA